MPDALYWREPAWLLLTAYPLLLALWRRHHRTRLLDAYADRRLQPWVVVAVADGAASRWRGIALAVSWLLLCLAMAGPRLPLQVPPSAAAPAGSLVAVIDLSRSMSASDVLPDRRGRALAQLRGWLGSERLPALGLVVFAGRAHLYLPPTSDRRILRHYLDQLADLRLPTLGNDLAGALRLAQEALPDKGRGVVLLLSDGDLGPAQRAAAERQSTALSRAGIDFRVRGIGGPAGSPLRDDRGEWLMDGDRPVLSSLHADWLQRLALAGGGRYLADTVHSLDAIWSSSGPRIAPQHRDAVLWRELYPWLLAPAALLLFVALLGRIAVPAGAALGATTALLALVLLPPDARAETPQAVLAHQALTAGDYQAARERYREIAGYAGRFGEGVSCYRLGDYDCAREAFAEAAWLAGDERAQGRAVFNLANSRFQLGDYERAANLYQDAIRHGVAVERADANLRYTRELVKEMARLAGTQDESARRAGRGVRSGPAAAGITPPPDTRLSLADGPAQNGADAGPSGGFDTLVQRGLARLQLREVERSGQRRRGDWVGRPDIATSVPGTRIWQRLFEIEEGFPAPLQRPVGRPMGREGEQAW